jgi:hypothetical protein
MSKKATIRKKLRDELTKRFVPALHELGFNGPDRISGNTLDHNYRRVVLNRIQILSIHFDKWQRPQFVLDFWIEPPDGFDALMQHGGEFIQGRAHPGWRWGTELWIRADRPWWHALLGLTSSREQHAVTFAIEVLPQIERWWHDHKPTKHISVMPSTFRPQNEIKAAQF